MKHGVLVIQARMQRVTIERQKMMESMNRHRRRNHKTNRGGAIMMDWRPFDQEW